MNLVYRYLMARSKAPYRRGVRYLLLKNYDTEPAYLLSHVRIEPGDYFVLEEQQAYELFNYVLYDKKVVIVKAIQTEGAPEGEDGTNEDYGTAVI
jgi:hypothetical protein